MDKENINKELNIQDRIHLVSAIDQGFLQHFYVMFKSLLENTNLECTYIHFHFIYHSIAENELRKIQDFFSSDHVQIDYYEINHYDMVNFYTSEHISLATYYRILIPQLLDKNIGKVIYLDSDMIICKDIWQLWLQDIHSHAIGAVVDLQGEDRMDELKIPNTFSYFNAGLLIINLHYWRENNISDKVIAFIEENPDKLKYWDQDALNAVLYDKCFYLPYQWNVQTNAYQVSGLEDSIKVAVKEPFIVHYTTASKPWHISNKHPLKEKYHFFLEKTPYKNYSMLDSDTINILNKKKKVFIFGAGETGQKVMEFLVNYKNIEGFLDNDSNKNGITLCGKKIYSLNIIKKYNLQDIGVIVSSGHYKSIANQLKEIGLTEKIDFVHQM